MSASREFKSIFTIRSLKKIYYKSVKYNSAIGIDRINIKVFERNLDQNLAIVKNKSVNGTYIFSQYREKLLSKGANKLPRVISIPTLRDKLALKALFQVLVSVYSGKTPYLHEIIQGATKTISENKFDCVIRLDVKNYYPSICHAKLIALISKKIKKKEILHLITNSITQSTVESGKKGTKISIVKGIPQGLPISNILANIYLQPIDEKYSKKTTIAYFRYVDDFLILCNKNNADKIIDEIKKDCGKIDLELHGDDEPTKCIKGDISSKFNFLGYVFSGSLVSVREKSLDNLRESIIKLMTYYKYSKYHDKNMLLWSLNLRISGCQFNNTKYGWLFYFSQINDLTLLESLDYFVRKQLIRFNLNPDDPHIKRFVKTYYEITKNLSNTKYIPNYDEIELKEEKTILQNIFHKDVTGFGKEEIDHLFKKKIFQNVKQLEKDLSKNS